MKENNRFHVVIIRLYFPLSQAIQRINDPMELVGNQAQYAGKWGSRGRATKFRRRELITSRLRGKRPPNRR